MTAMRRPTAAPERKVFPALAALSAVVAGCHDPQCGTTRADELRAHGANLRSGVRASDALREISVALGLRAHPPAPPHETGVTAGAIAPVTVLPPPPPPQPTPPSEVMRPGQAIAVRPTPPTPPPAPPPTPVHNVRHGGRPARVNPATDF